MVIDTSLVVSAIERKSPVAVQRIDRMRDQSIRSMIVLGELQSGVETAGQDAQVSAIRRRTLRAYLLASRPVELLPIEPVAREFARLTARSKHEGIKIGQNDRWILAEAAQWDVPVWTCDEAMYELARLARGRSAAVLVESDPSTR